MKNKIIKLIDLKTIITLVLVGTFIYLTVTEKTISPLFEELLRYVIVFFFGTQVGKILTSDTSETNTNGVAKK